MIIHMQNVYNKKCVNMELDEYLPGVGVLWKREQVGSQNGNWLQILRGYYTGDAKNVLKLGCGDVCNSVNILK